MKRLPFALMFAFSILVGLGLVAGIALVLDLVVGVLSSKWPNHEVTIMATLMGTGAFVFSFLIAYFLIEPQAEITDKQNNEGKTNEL